MTQWGARPGDSLGYMSRVPVTRAEWHNPRVLRHAFLELILAGTPWRIFGVHLSAVPSPFTASAISCEVVADGPIKDASDHFPLLSVLDV